MTDTKNTVNPETANAIWDYIENHQNENNCYQTIANQFKIQLTTARNLIWDWAVGSRELFNKTLLKDKNV